MAAVAKLAKRSLIEVKVQEAGRLQQQISALNKQYKSIRQEIEAEMVIPDGETETTIESDGYIAKLFWGKHTVVHPKKVYDLDQDLFWRLCQMPVGTLKKMLSLQDFAAVAEELPNDLPALEIGKAKDSE